MEIDYCGKLDPLFKCNICGCEERRPSWNGKPDNSLCGSNGCRGTMVLNSGRYSMDSFDCRVKRF